MEWITWQIKSTKTSNEINDTQGKTSVLNSVGLVPSCHRVFVGPKFFLADVSWVRTGACFMDLKFFHVSISSAQIFFSCVQNIFWWVFRGSKIFSYGYFVGPKFFLADISWVTCEYVSEEYE